VVAAWFGGVDRSPGCLSMCRLDSAALDQVKSDVNDQIGGLGAVILNSMLTLAGEGGVNNLAALGTSTGDCDDCGCAWCYTFDFETTDGDFLPADAGLGTYVSAQGWTSTFAVLGDGNGYRIIQLQRAFTGHIQSVDLVVQLTSSGAPGYPSNWVYVTTNVSPIITSGGTPGTAGDYPFNWSGDQDVTGITYIQISAGFGSGGFDPGGEVILKTITLRGTGDNPFGADNC